MTTIDTIDLSNVTGGAGTGFEPAGVSCAPDTRNAWQKVAPTMLGGKPNPVCTPHDARVWFDKGALTDAPVGQRQFTPDAKRDISNLAGGL